MKEDFIAYDNLRIAPYELQYIQNMTIENKINDHGILKLTGVIDDQYKDQYVQSTDEDTVIEIFYEKDGLKSGVFYGVVTNIKVTIVNSVYTLFLEAKTIDYQLDLEKKKRDFQDVNMITHELIDEVMKNYGNANYQINIPNEAIGKFVLQYNETDYEFLKRIASKYNEPLISAMDMKNMHIYIGVPDIKVENKENIIDYSISKEINEYNKVKNNDKENVSETAFITYKIRTQQIFNVGENFNFASHRFYVKKAIYKIEGGLLINNYELRTKEGIRTNTLYNMNVIGISVNGSILDVQRDKVKVKLNINTNIDTSKAYWFPYATVASSPDGGGWDCMPKAGEEIRLNCPTKDESEAFVVNAISGASGKSGAEAKNDRMSNPDIKSLQTDSGQEVKFTSSGVVIECGGGAASMNLNKDGTIQVTGQENINIACAKKLSLRAENEMTIGAQKSIDLLCDSGSSLIMSEGDEILISGTRTLNNG